MKRYLLCAVVVLFCSCTTISLSPVYETDGGQEGTFVSVSSGVTQADAFSICQHELVSAIEQAANDGSKASLVLFSPQKTIRVGSATILTGSFMFYYSGQNWPTKRLPNRMQYYGL